MNEDKNEREVDTMAIMKPIQATPELSGRDAVKLLSQTNMKPTAQAMKKIICYMVSLIIYVKNELFDRK